ncbi:hypothetical protein ACSV5N_07490 [Agrobacterium salinitolerans]|uniref:hypothetical protein n=1 Tax=Agrobacterium salinitolerans TaxID=1183413 RepID=UPI003FD3EDC6
MAKNSILDYDTTPDNNTDMGGIGIQGTSAVKNFDDAFRTLMSQIADFTGGSTIASGTTTDLSTVKGQYVTVSGTSTITSFGTAKAGWVKFIRFSNVATITHNATSMILPGAANITTQAGDFALFVSEGGGNWRCLAYSRAAVLTRPTQRGQIYGLTLSNNASDATNDIDIAAGECASDETIPSLMTLSSSLTKRLDAAWAVGTGNGGLDTGSIANTTYHVWLIQRSDTGVVDALFSTNATSPTMPSGYDRKRRIGSIIRSSGSLRAFIQIGDYFWHSTRVQDVTAADPGSAAVTRTLTVPTGIPVIAFGKAAIVCTAASGANTRFLLLTSLSQPDADPNVVGGTIAITTPAVPSATGHRAQGDFTVPTNNNGQVRSRMNASDPAWVVSIITEGWIDTRIV